MTAATLTREQLVARITIQMAALREQRPECLERSQAGLLPGTYITVRGDQCIWIGDHYAEEWWQDSALLGMDADRDLRRVVTALDLAMTEMGVSG